jgi:hypothetical protein
MKEPPQLFDGLSLRDALQKVGQRGFTLRYRVVPGAAGGTWIAQVSRRGEFIRAQHVDPLRAVEILTSRLTRDKFGREPRWQKWRRRPWRRDDE